jgi:sterol desaturase/sphingolipid hydroxylase (fatty acid hydroxylase superfamily)
MSIQLETLIAYKGLIVAAWLALFLVGEHLRPADMPPGGAVGFVRFDWARVGRNLALWAINAVLSLLIILRLTEWASGHALAWRPAWWSGAPGLAFDVLLLDFLIYWWHRFNHTVPFLWRFHEVHHLDRFLDSTSALRFHFGEVLLSAAARAAIIVLIGFPLVTILLFETLLLLATIFHHSNLRLPAAMERVLSRLVITPSIHWVHHHALRSDTDSNYGTIFSFWDRLFGTASGSRRMPAMAIGVEGTGEQPLLRLIVRPFVRR